MRIYTIGHSTRSLEEMIGLLERFEVRLLADVRSIPRSRHNPQFNSDSFAKKLANHGIDYQHLAGLRGLRKTRADSPSTGWRNDWCGTMMSSTLWTKTRHSQQLLPISL